MSGLSEITERIRQLYDELRINLLSSEIEELIVSGYDEGQLERFLSERAIIGIFFLISAIRRSKLTLDEFEKSDRFLFVRHKLIADILSEDLPAGSKVLEVGCGRGLNLCELALRGYDAYGVDVSEEALSIAAKLAKKANCCVILRKVDGVSLPFNEASFDCVLYIWTIHELKTDDLAGTLNEAGRVIKPRGFVYVIDQEEIAPLNDVKQLAGGIGLNLAEERKLLKVYDHGICSYATLLKFRKG